MAVQRFQRRGGAPPATRHRRQQQAYKASGSYSSSRSGGHKEAASSSSSSAAATATPHLSFGNFDFQEFHRIGQRGGGVRELHSLLRAARGKKHYQDGELLKSRRGAEERKGSLLHTAVLRASGTKVKDDPVKLSRALAKRRQKKRQSAKRWAKRVEALEKSVDSCVKDFREGKKKKSGFLSNKEAKKKSKLALKEASGGGKKGGGRDRGGGRSGGGRGGGGGKRGRK